MPSPNRPSDPADDLADIRRRLRALETASRTGLSKTGFVRAADDGSYLDAVDDLAWSPIDIAPPVQITAEGRRFVCVAAVEATDFCFNSDYLAQGVFVGVSVDGAEPSADTVTSQFSIEVDPTQPPAMVTMCQIEFPQENYGSHTFELWVTNSQSEITGPRTPPRWRRPSLLVLVLA